MSIFKYMTETIDIRPLSKAPERLVVNVRSVSHYVFSLTVGALKMTLVLSVHIKD